MQFDLTFSADTNIETAFSGADSEAFALSLGETQPVGSGTNDHTQLMNRDAAGQHPISAITELQTQLDNKSGAVIEFTNSELDEILGW